MSSSNNINSKIIGIQFSILSPEEIERYSVAEITSKETYVGIRPKVGGLFDPRMGVLEPGLICPTDGMNYIDCPGYFGHIRLAKPVFYIHYIDTIIEVLKCVCIKCSKLLISKTMNKHVLKMPKDKRWSYIHDQCKCIGRCGDDIENGCGCRQPSKIRLEGFSTIIAEWANEDNSSGEDGQPGGEKKENMVIKITPEMVIKIFKKISDEDVNFMGFSSMWSRPDWMVCQVFAVPPPSVRPSVKHDAQQRSEDDLTHIIINIIKTNNTLKEKMEQGVAQKVIDDWTSVLQYYIATLVDNKISGASPITQRSGRALKSISERHKGKTGRVRGNLMGKRVDYSARSVITPDPELSITEIGVPLKIAKNLTKPVTVTKNNMEYLYFLIHNGPDVHPGAKILEKKNGTSISLRYVDRKNIILDEGDIVHRHMLDGDYVLFNRQPTLHRMSMMGHIVRVLKHGDTFRMNVADTKPYNADFDGDEMNLHMPQNPEAETELRYLACIPNQLISPANNKSIIGIFQDNMIGSYLFTREGIKFTDKQMMNLMMKTNKFDTSIFKSSKQEEYTNFEVLSEILPPMTLNYRSSLFKSNEDPETSNHMIKIKNGIISRGQLDKGSFGGKGIGLIQRIKNDFSKSESVDFIDNLQGIITEYMKTTGFSVGISDLIADEETNQKITSVINDTKKEVSSLIDQVHLGIFENKTGKTNEEHFETQVNTILNQASNDAGKEGLSSLSGDNRFVSIVVSGSKGNNLNIAQMISCLGQQNVDGKRIPYGYANRTLPHFKQFDDTPRARGFVENSFIGGLTPEELFFHAMGGRVGLIDTAVKTSQTGYIQRRLIKGMEDLQISYDKTVRNNKNKVIQFNYGGTNFDTTHIENMSFKLLEMTISDIYEHYAYTFDRRVAHLKTIYEKDVITSMKDKQNIAELNIKTKKLIDEAIKIRDEYIEKVLYNMNDNDIYLPINFPIVINNIKNQCGITENHLTNLTPLECYAMIDKYYYKLNRLFTPCRMFKIIYYFYMNPKNIIHKHKYNSKSLELLCEKIVYMYKKSVVNPGEMVGLISAQSIGEPTTQLTLNTFHYAGVASKSNVTRGVPRIEEILTLTKKMKNPSLTIFLKEEHRSDKNMAYKTISKLEHTKFVDLIKKAEIYYDPNDKDTNIEYDEKIMDDFNEFREIMDDCYSKEETKSSGEDNPPIVNKWILRIEMDETAMLDMNITNEEVYRALVDEYKNDITCYYQDMNSNDNFEEEGKENEESKNNESASNIVFRIRLETKKMASFNQEDQIYMVKMFQKKILEDLIIRGVKNIDKINIRVVNKYHTLNKETMNYEQKDINVLDTVGSNLLEILALNEDIDVNKTFSNDINEMYSVLGIEAARKCIFNEIIEVMEDSTYINHHHIALLADRMCCNEKLVSIFRHGINKDNIGPIAKASFEETTEMFLQAAKHGEVDEMRGVSANIMCGQEGHYGTSSFKVLFDMPEYRKVKNFNNSDDSDDEEEVSKQQIRDKLNDKSNKVDHCSIETLKIDNNLNENLIKETVHLEDDDDYELDI